MNLAMCSIPFESAIVCMNIMETHLLVYTAGNTIYYYSLHSDKGDSWLQGDWYSIVNHIVPILQQQIHLQDIVMNPSQVRAIERRSTDQDPEVVKKSPLMILARDALLYMHVDVGSFLKNWHD